jgi:hypothetical protein
MNSSDRNRQDDVVVSNVAAPSVTEDVVIKADANGATIKVVHIKERKTNRSEIVMVSSWQSVFKLISQRRNNRLDGSAVGLGKFRMKSFPEYVRPFEQRLLLGLYMTL